MKKVVTLLWVKMTKEIFAKNASKVIPVVGASISGGITFASYKPMAERLRKELFSYSIADVEYYNEIKAQIMNDNHFSLIGEIKLYMKKVSSF